MSRLFVHFDTDSERWHVCTVREPLDHHEHGDFARNQWPAAIRWTSWLIRTGRARG